MPENLAPDNTEQASDAETVAMTQAGHSQPALPEAQAETPWLRGFARLMVEGGRVSLLRRPRWDRVTASPSIIVAMTVAYFLLVIVAERIAIVGPARFYGAAITAGWFSFASCAWICYSLRRAAQPLHSDSAPDASRLFVLSVAQGWILACVLQLPLILLMRTEWMQASRAGFIVRGLLSLLVILLIITVQSVFYWRAGDRRRLPMVTAVLLMLLTVGLEAGTQQPQFWYPEEHGETAQSPDQVSESADTAPEITQEIFETQAALLEQKLDEVLPQRPGVTDLYSLTFAPYGEEDVFLRETSMVSQVMAQRFDAAGRGLQLANNPKTMETLPWATPLNLQRAIAHIASRMDVNEDILFIHMSSHGASDGELSAGMWPLTVNPITPEDLKSWLDDAGIKNRVISISACFAGNWVQPLSNPDTLVMTASDADHTSYGCGSKSDLTFFGRAMYDEQLRSKTLSFETAHANARAIIKQREEEAGKDDGYSNPQIAMGVNIRRKLQELEQRLQKNAAPAAIVATAR